MSDQPRTTNIESALQRNRAFAAAGGHQGAVVFPNLGLFVITCLDPRVDPAHFLGLALSDAMVVRNVGGRSDVKRPRSAHAISPRVTVSGHVYDVVTGLVQTILPAGSATDRNIERARDR